jgi:redox-sensitive bicupin YhaK (pirin superfamily)
MQPRFFFAVNRAMSRSRAAGPSWMNRPEQVKQAIEDYQSGRMGHLA